MNGTSPKTDKNWKRKANPADWYIKRIGKHSAPIQKAPRAGLDLETTVDYGVQQYGRHMYRWVVEQGRKHDLPTDFVLNALMLRFQSRLKSEDMEWLCEGLSAEEQATFQQELSVFGKSVKTCTERECMIALQKTSNRVKSKSMWKS